MDSSCTFPSGQVLTTEQFFDAIDRLAKRYPPTNGREPAVDTGAFLAAFNETFLELLTARRDGTVGYATAGPKGRRTPRTFQHQGHFRAWFLGCTRTRRRKAKATYGRYRQDYVDPVAPDHEPAEVTRAHAKRRQEWSRVLVCPFCRGSGLIEFRDTRTPLRRGNERQVGYEVRWIVKRINKSELDDQIAFAELLVKGKALLWPVERTKRGGAGSAPSLTTTRRNTCLRCGLGFAGGSTGAQLGHSRGVVPVIAWSEPAPLIPRPELDLDAQRARLLGPPLPYCGLPWYKSRCPDTADARTLRSVEAYADHLALERLSRDTAAGEARSKNDDTVVARQVGVRNRGDRVTARRLAYQAIQARAGVSFAQAIEDQFEADIQRHIEALAELRNGPRRRGWVQKMMAIFSGLARLREERRAGYPRTNERGRDTKVQPRNATQLPNLAGAAKTW